MTFEKELEKLIAKVEAEVIDGNAFAVNTVGHLKDLLALYRAQPVTPLVKELEALIKERQSEMKEAHDEHEVNADLAKIAAYRVVIDIVNGNRI